MLFWLAFCTDINRTRSLTKMNSQHILKRYRLFDHRVLRKLAFPSGLWTQSQTPEARAKLHNRKIPTVVWTRRSTSVTFAIWAFFFWNFDQNQNWVFNCLTNCFFFFVCVLQVETSWLLATSNWEQARRERESRSLRTYKCLLGENFARSKRSSKWWVSEYLSPLPSLPFRSWELFSISFSFHFFISTYISLQLRAGKKPARESNAKFHYFLLFEKQLLLAAVVFGTYETRFYSTVRTRHFSQVSNLNDNFARSTDGRDLDYLFLYIYIVTNVKQPICRCISWEGKPTPLSCSADQKNLQT